MKRIILQLLAKTLKVKPYMVGNVLKDFKNDFKNENRVSLKQKIWAYRRGFTGSKIIEYGLTEDNYKKYLSDLAYYRLYPLNNEYVYWINDKITTKYILNAYNDYLPEYYFYIDKGRITPIFDYKEKNNVTADTVMDLLKQKQKLAIKKEASSLGIGFYKAEYKQDEFYLNDEKYDEAALKGFLSTLNGYIVTEFLDSREDIAKIYPDTANSMRLWVVKDGDKPAEVVYALLRFGTDNTGLIDNITAGGLFSVVDLSTGCFDYGYTKEDGVLKRQDTHPDTGVPIKGCFQDWGHMINKIKEIADYMYQLSWMGFDVVVTDDGFKILEINSHHSVTTYQSFHPLLDDGPASEFLNKKLKEKNLV